MSKKSVISISKSEVVSAHGAVGAMHPLAAEAGVEILRQGGNAFDAAVAIGFAIGVVEPFNSGVGAIAVLVAHDAKTGRNHVIDGTGPLPAAISPDLYELADESERSGVYQWRATKNDANNTGYLAPAVPGTPAALCAAHERWGKLPLADVMAPAIRLAEEGWELDWYVSHVFAMQSSRLRNYPDSLRTFFRPDGNLLVSGSYMERPDKLIQKDLGRTLRLIAEKGAAGFYTGETAQKIADDMKANGGVLSYDDLASYKPRFYDDVPLNDYHGFQIVQSPHNNGGPTVVEALNIIENDHLADYGFGTATATHLVIEAQRRAFRDRFRYLGDPEFAPVPSEAIISKAYAAARRESIDPFHATPNVDPLDPWPFQPNAPAGAGGGRVSINGDGLTTHFNVIDSEHNMVSCTSTLGAHFGSAVVAKDTGVLLNNGVMWFDPEPGSIVTIGPGKRIMTAGTPTLVLRDGAPFMAIGAPGGRRVISAIFQCLVNVLDHGMRPQEAIASPRVHAENATVEIDSRFSEAAFAGLRRRGHNLLVREETAAQSVLARPNGIMIDPETGLFYGGATPFGPATAMGV
jgi:gamma-glutamyltranspeptidase/glutathione hydrolase